MLVVCLKCVASSREHVNDTGYRFMKKKNSGKLVGVDGTLVPTVQI